MDNKKNAAENGTTQIIKGGTANTGTTPATTPKITKTADTTSTETKATTTRTGKAATGTETPEAVSLVNTKTGKDDSTMSPSTDNSITATIKTDTAQTAEDTTGTLVPAYLSGGYYKGEGKNRYPDPALVDQAETIGKSLAAGGVTATAFNRLMRTLKAGKNKPFEAQTGALKKVIPQVIDLENRKKAPPLLREIVERNRAAVQSEADFAACLDHLRDIGVFLVAEQK